MRFLRNDKLSSVLLIILTSVNFCLVSPAQNLARQSLSTGGGTVTIPRLRRQNHVRDGATAKARVFQRMGWALPSGHAKMSTPIRLSGGLALDDPVARPISSGHVAPTQQSGTASGTAVETPQTSGSTVLPTATGYLASVPEPYYAEFLSHIRIGGQTMQVDFDTGSSDFWIFSTFLPKRQRGRHQYIYDPSTSKSFQNLSDLSWRIVYGDGSAAQGTVGQDNVALGDILVPNQSIELARNVTPGFTQDGPNDGLVGLGFSNINNGMCSTLSFKRVC